MNKILSVSTTAQNMLKVSALHKAFAKQKKKITHNILYTSNTVYSEQLTAHFTGIDLPEIKYCISIDANCNKIQHFAQAMIEFEEIVNDFQPDLIILTGFQDVTLACALTASRLKIPISHTDSGLRSFDRQCTDELNRIMTDVLCQYHIISEHSAMKNLRDEGKENPNILFAGNLLADTLNKLWDDIINEENAGYDGLKSDDDYLLFVPALNIDENELPIIRDIFVMLGKLSERCPVFIILKDPKKENYEKYGLFKGLSKNCKIIPPLNYLQFLSLMYNSRAVITNSTSIQEEATYLGVQCITVLNYTERPVTIDVGTNHLVGEDPAKAEKVAIDILDGVEKPGRLPENWDGKAGKRIAEWLADMEY